MAINAPERSTILRQEARNPEVLHPITLDAVYSRLILGDEALNPNNTNLAPVTKEGLVAKSIDQRDYTPFEQGSRLQRAAYWKDKGTFDEQRQAWTESTIKTFQEGQAFFRTEAGQHWADVFSRLGISAVGFSKKDADLLYDEYLSGQAADQKSKKFVKKITESSKYSHTDLAAVAWIGSIFGVNPQESEIAGANELVTDYVFAEAQVARNPEPLVESANQAIQVQDNTGQTQTISRINYLNNHEIRRLNFFHQAEVRPQPQPNITPPTETTPQTNPAVAPTPSTTPDTTNPAEPPIPKPDKPTTPEQKTIEEAIIAGKGFEVIDKIGWGAYRDTVAKLSFKHIIAHKLTEVDQLKETSEGLPPPISGADLVEANKQARDTVWQMTRELPVQFANNPDFTCSLTGSDKLSINGKDHNPYAYPMTRLYFYIYNRTTPQAYMALFESLQDEGALDKADLSLFTVNFDLAHTAEDVVLKNNNILLYIPGQDPQTMEKIARAVGKAKQKHPEAFALHPMDEAKAKEQMMWYMNIPLDNTTGWVEMPDGNSYDRLCMPMGRSLSPSYFDHNIPLHERLIKLKDALPEYQENNLIKIVEYRNRSGLERRRAHMPALLFEDNIPSESIRKLRAQRLRGLAPLEKESFLNLKSKLISQIEGFGMLGEKLMGDWQNNPTLTMEDLFETVKEYYKQYFFEEEDLSKINRVIWEAFNRKRLIAETRAKYPDPKEFAKAVLGVDIKGTVEIEDGGYVAILRLEDDDMAEVLKAKRHINPSTSRRVPEGQVVRTNLGFRCMTLRKNTPSTTKTHEMQHAYFYLLNDAISLSRSWPEDIVMRNKGEAYHKAISAPDEDSKRKYLRESYKGSAIRMLYEVQDEILAFEMGGTDPAKIISIFTNQDGNPYDYRAYMRSHLPTTVDHLGGSRYSQMVQEEYERVMVKGYESTIKEAVGAFEDLKKAGYTVDQVTQILTIRPINKWNKTARRLLEAKAS